MVSGPAGQYRKLSSCCLPRLETCSLRTCLRSSQRSSHIEAIQAAHTAVFIGLKATHKRFFYVGKKKNLPSAFATRDKFIRELGFFLRQLSSRVISCFDRYELPYKKCYQFESLFHSFFSGSACVNVTLPPLSFYLF